MVIRVRKINGSKYQVIRQISGENSYMRNRMTKVRGCELDFNMTTENQILRLMAYINQLGTTKQLKEEGATGTSTKTQLAMSSNIREDAAGEF